MAHPGQGWNPLHGADQGPPPPGLGSRRLPQAQPYPLPAVYQYPPPPQVVYAQPPPTPAPAPQVIWPAPQPPVYYQPYQGYNPALPPNPQPAAAPTNNAIPGIHLTNPSGGVGLPPGYDYLFPLEHTTIHCIQSSTPPWQTQGTIHAWDSSKFHKIMVPVNTTIAELMAGLGCDNKDSKKNVVHEVWEKGNGLWNKGLSISGDQKDRVKKPIKEYGWDKSRTGFPKEKQVVWLYLTKD